MTTQAEDQRSAGASTWRPVLTRAALIAAIVGPCLILINQAEAMMGLASVDWRKALLTCAVPFCVAALSGYLSARSARKRLASLAADAAAKLAAERDARLAAEAEIDRLRRGGGS